MHLPAAVAPDYYPPYWMIETIFRIGFVLTFMLLVTVMTFAVIASFSEKSYEYLVWAAVCASAGLLSIMSYFVGTGPVIGVLAPYGAALAFLVMIGMVGIHIGNWRAGLLDRRFELEQQAILADTDDEAEHAPSNP